ncbi:MAG: adenosine kinase [Pirellulaceae bacterium]|nr:MAG: adenosine kinase [Pirellulaceae bacterium]
MEQVLVVGSVAFDSVQTPWGSCERVMGGSAVYFAYAASFFSPVALVGAVGEDWPDEFTQILQQQPIDTSGLCRIPGKKTFMWRGKYKANLNERETLEVHLNVLGEFQPRLSPEQRRSRIAFLANGSPRTQLAVLEQLDNPALVVADTMDLWIREESDLLRELLRRLDGVVLNDGEAKLLTQEENLVLAGQRIRAMGPRFVVIKKGEHGALYFSERDTIALPAYPTARVVDPTGAGDSFAGGMLGYLASCEQLTSQEFRRALVYGTLVASFVVEDFSLDRLRQIDRSTIDKRLETYRSMFQF